MKVSKGLTAQQKTFITEYLKCFNATEAAKRAGYSVRSAYAQGSDILNRPVIQAEIQKRLARRAMSADEVLARLSDQARGNQLPFLAFDDDGAVYFDFNHPEAKDHMHVIKTVRTKRKRIVIGQGKNAVPWEQEYVEVELYSSQAALELLGKYHKLWSDRFELTGPVIIDNLDELIEKAYGHKRKEG